MISLQDPKVGSRAVSANELSKPVAVIVGIASVSAGALSSACQSTDSSQGAVLTTELQVFSYAGWVGTWVAVQVDVGCSI